MHIAVIIWGILTFLHLCIAIGIYIYVLINRIEFGILPESTTYPFSIFLSPTQWPYPHFYLPMILTFFCSPQLPARVHKAVRFIYYTMIPVLLEVLWEIIESFCTELGEALPADSFVKATLMHFSEMRRDTVGDLLQALLGGGLAAILIVYVIEPQKTMCSMWCRRKWWQKVLYVVFIILFGCNTFMGIVYAGNVAVGYWTWIVTEQFILAAIAYLDYLLGNDEKYFETWYLFIIPFSFCMHWINGFPKIPAYITTWLFGIVFLMYGFLIKN